MKSFKTRIEAIAFYLPETVVSNGDLELENPSWNMEDVQVKAGVLSRRIAGRDETSLDLAVKACEKLFKEPGCDQASLDGIIFCTQSPDYVMPSNAHLIHNRFDFRQGVFAFDINLACSGYIYGAAIANSFIASGMARRILLITSETYSKFIHPKDRSARVLFGDGAAATLFSATESGRGFIDVMLSSNGKDYEKFYIPAGGIKRPKSLETSQEIQDKNGNIRTLETIHMDGFGVWSFINTAVPDQLNDILSRNRMTLEDIDKIIFHQASQMTLDSLIKKLRLDRSKVFINLADKGNTVSASIPIALKEAWDRGEVKRGDKILLCGFGVGLSYGTIMVEF